MLDANGHQAEGQCRSYQTYAGLPFLRGLRSADGCQQASHSSVCKLGLNDATAAVPDRALAREIWVGSFHQQALFELHDPISDVENFVVMGHHHDCGLVFTGQGSEQIHYIATGFLVESGGGFVGEQQLG